MCVMAKYGYHDIISNFDYDRTTPPTSPQRAQQAAHYAEREQHQMGSPPGRRQPQPNPQNIPNALVVCHSHTCAIL